MAADKSEPPLPPPPWSGDTYTESIQLVVPQPVAASWVQPSTPLVPVSPIIAKRSYASALSYVGSTRRTIAWIKRIGRRSTAAAVAAWTAGVTFLALMYVFLVFWYAIVFGLFGVFMFPFRLMRRSQRKNQHMQEQQLATMQAMLLEQQRSRDERLYP